MVVPETGILLNDFLYWFDLDADSPNVVAPHKKVEMCLSPGMIWRNDKVFACMGTPGSHGIMETTPQFMSNLMDFEMSVQAAIEAPRVRPQESDRVIAEGRIPNDVLAGLERARSPGRPSARLLDGLRRRAGHHDRPRQRHLLGRADPRRDGYAVGW